MSVKVEIRGKRETAEYAAGQKLRAIFTDGLPKHATGHIVILAGATLFGQPIKDVDLIAYGNISGFKKKLRFRDQEDTLISGDVFINNFCMCFETKRHTARDVVLDGLVLKVQYNGKLHDVTYQSEKQKYALKNFIEDRTHQPPPYICNFIWLTGVSPKSLQELVGNDESAKTRHNYLPSSFSLTWLFQLVAIQHKPYKIPQKDHYICNAVTKDRDIHEYDICAALNLFTEMRKTAGDLTRKKLEKISQRLLKDQNYADAIGKKLLVVSGRAGTGKTIKLLRLAYDLARNHGNRCLILTYNLALVSDIKRLLALQRMPDDVDSYSVNIGTLHKFFYELSIGFEIGAVSTSKNGIKYISNFVLKYDDYLDELMEYIDAGAIGDKDIQELMKSRHDEIAWDFVMIDEAQDWSPKERDLIYRIFGHQNIIIADGIDQMVRSQVHCNWVRNTPNHRITERRCLRQKRNLVEFVNAYADEFDLGWHLDPIDEYEGGKVIITSKSTPFDIFKREFSTCEQFGNRAYEMMFLTPPFLVRRDGKNEEGKPVRYFGLAEDFKAHGFQLWDGTRQDLRSNYPSDVNEHRLLQYDSCRGLEGWTVVCLQLDEFVRYKTETYKEEEGQANLFQEDVEDRKQRFVHLWSLIPLTRAIDTVIITLKNPSSSYAARLKSVADKMSDFVEWIDTK